MLWQHSGSGKSAECSGTPTEGQGWGWSVRECGCLWKLECWEGDHVSLIFCYQIWIDSSQLSRDNCESTLLLSRLKCRKPSKNSNKDRARARVQLQVLELLLQFLPTTCARKATGLISDANNEELYRIEGMLIEAKMGWAQAEEDKVTEKSQHHIYLLPSIYRQLLSWSCDNWGIKSTRGESWTCNLQSAWQSLRWSFQKQRKVKNKSMSGQSKSEWVDHQCLNEKSRLNTFTA